MNELQKREDTLFERISTLIDLAHKRVKTTIDTTMVYTYYYIGQYIVEDEQQGEQRAQYGKAVLKNLSVRLTDKYGEGWSVETLKKCRFFYLTYKDNIIGSTMWTQSEEDKKMNLVYNVDPFQDKKEKQYLPNAPKISETLVNLKTNGISHSLGLIISFLCASTIPMHAVFMR